MWALRWHGAADFALTESLLSASCVPAWQALVQHLFANPSLASLAQHLTAVPICKTTDTDRTKAYLTADPKRKHQSPLPRRQHRPLRLAARTLEGLQQPFSRE